MRRLKTEGGEVQARTVILRMYTNAPKDLLETSIEQAMQCVDEVGVLGDTLYCVNDLTVQQANNDRIDTTLLPTEMQPKSLDRVVKMAADHLERLCALGGHPGGDEGRLSDERSVAEVEQFTARVLDLVDPDKVLYRIMEELLDEELLGHRLTEQQRDQVLGALQVRMEF